MPNLTAAQAVKELILEAIEAARQIAEEDEARLGRSLTDGEVGRIADMVERQLRTALVLAR